MKNTLKENLINQKSLFSIKKFFASRLEPRSYNLEADSGMTLVFTVLIVSTILMIALALGIFSFGQMRMIYSAKDSAYAIFGGTSGIEMALYGIRINDDCAGGTPTYSSTLTNGSSYDVTVAPGCSLSSATISSNGKYRQTTRKIEASY